MGRASAASAVAMLAWLGYHHRRALLAAAARALHSLALAVLRAASAAGVALHRVAELLHAAICWLRSWVTTHSLTACPPAVRRKCAHACLFFRHGTRLCRGWAYPPTPPCLALVADSIR
jgi:hypothetical protein